MPFGKDTETSPTSLLHISCQHKFTYSQSQ